MRISDWSSDVCSSDLRTSALHVRARRGRVSHIASRRGAPRSHRLSRRTKCLASDRLEQLRLRPTCIGPACPCPNRLHPHQCCACPSPQADRRQRSEEHTSELQSLMRISYAVFCLKKKKNIQQ